MSTFTVRELDSAPKLSGLFAKAAVTGLGRSGSGSGSGELPTLPDYAYARAGVRADPAELAEYARVCGFRVSDVLPVTYPHLLVFPLQTKLMTDPAFPFPLIGLVHVANRIHQVRPVHADEPLVVRVHADNPRPHERGVQFDMVSEALADGQPVWHEVSTYLRRTGGSGSGGSGSGGEKREMAPPERPVAVWRVPGDIGRRYARVSGDHNPIHLHPLTAKPFGFPTAIAHGMWSAARCLAFFEGRLPDEYTVDVRFKLPVRLPAKVALTVHGRPVDSFALVDARSGKPHLDATIGRPAAP
jgi:acyl dehydratase